MVFNVHGWKCFPDTVKSLREELHRRGVSVIEQVYDTLSKLFYHTWCIRV